MTGLDHAADTILSISCIITSATLEVIDSGGYDAIIHHSKSQLDNMSEWCIKHHGDSGLTKQCLASTTTAERAAQDLRDYVKKHVPQPGEALLAGNSVHVDKLFLMSSPFKSLLAHLHYRIFDVSAMKEMVRRWCTEDVLARAPVKQMRHEARGDVEESIEEARFYMKLLENVKLVDH
jgi:oligoribonuclease